MVPQGPAQALTRVTSPDKPESLLECRSSCWLFTHIWCGCCRIKGRPRWGRQAGAVIRQPSAQHKCPPTQRLRAPHPHPSWQARRGSAEGCRAEAPCGSHCAVAAAHASELHHFSGRCAAAGCRNCSQSCGPSQGKLLLVFQTLSKSE